MQMSTNVRYIVNSTSDLTVYELLGFRVVMHPGPGFAALERDGVKLFLNVPGGGGGAGEPVGGSMPQPGGWNRIQVEVDSLDATLARLADAGITARDGVISGIGGRQALVEDASTNPIELFEPAPRER
ncbi:MAG TPA: VOC family protein [Aeromicrobium sp.]|jgi:predicted enzyme related to lactoylglutathione lyase|nr:VOC family protein [Aeromicrobium sp.]HKY56551.1 VOC family protein [Aeromicrobium sp.]